MTTIDLADARRIIVRAFEHTAALNLQPLSVVVLDAGGHIKAFERQDGAASLRFQVAHGKAYGALGLGMGSRALMQRAEQQPWFIETVNGAVGGALVPVPGGVLVRTSELELIGAVGVSGDSSDNDEAVAVAGIEAVGFLAETG